MSVGFVRVSFESGIVRWCFIYGVCGFPSSKSTDGAGRFSCSCIRVNCVVLPLGM